MERRDVVLARVFFSDSPDAKVRPAIVLSGKEYNASGFVLLASITTAGDEFCLPLGEADADCAFEKGSGARFDGIIKLPARQILRRIGKTAHGFHLRLVEKITAMLK